MFRKDDEVGGGGGGDDQRSWKETGVTQAAHYKTVGEITGAENAASVFNVSQIKAGRNSKLDREINIAYFGAE